MKRFSVTPADAGLRVAPVEAIRGGDAAHNAAALLDVLRGAGGAYHDTVVLNAAAALVVGGRTTDLAEGASLARAALAGGAALAKLRALQHTQPA